jgi:hypothetical protein
MPPGWGPGVCRAGSRIRVKTKCGIATVTRCVTAGTGVLSHVVRRSPFPTESDVLDLTAPAAVPLTASAGAERHLPFQSAAVGAQGGDGGGGPRARSEAKVRTGGALRLLATSFTHTHSRSHARTHVHARTRTLARTHAHAHARARTHTYTRTAAVRTNAEQHQSGGERTGGGTPPNRNFSASVLSPGGRGSQA